MGGAVRKKCLLEGIFREGPRKNYQSIYAYNKFRMADNSCHLCELKVATRSLFLYLPRGGVHFSTLLIVGWALWLFGLSTQSESDAMSVLGLHFERTGSFCFLPLERKLEQLHKEAHTEKESRPLTNSLSWALHWQPLPTHQPREWSCLGSGSSDPGDLPKLTPCYVGITCLCWAPLT